MLAAQTTFEDLGAPLAEIAFCFVDLETTGGSPRDSRITEIGAVRTLGGERLGAFQTLVDPGVPIPRFITHLTGIDDLLVREAPPIEAVLPSFLEFARGTVLVAHNAAFDHRFLSHEADRLGYERPEGPPICTAKLARRVLGADVPNVRLATVAEYLRTAVRPEHRAMADAEACAEVFHGLLEHAGRLGILTIGDLREAMRARGRPHYRKVRMADALPARPGVYVFRRPPATSGKGEVLYVGKARDVRARVRSYFYGDDRRKVDDLLAEAGEVDALECRSEVEALVMEARMIRQHQPRYNRRGKGWRRYAYLKLDLEEAWPRLKLVRTAHGRGAFLGPFRSRREATLAREALEEAFPIRRCTRSMGRSTRFAPCALADLGRCLAPCDGRVALERYEGLVRSLHDALSHPDGLLVALEGRMTSLARRERFEEAALQRDRLRAVVTALTRSRRERWLIEAGRLDVQTEGGRVAFRDGALLRRGDEPGFPLPLPVDAVDEVRAACSWLADRPPRVLEVDRAPAEPIAGGATLARLRLLLDAQRSSPPSSR